MDVLAIGCADGGTLCEPAGILPSRFEGRAACMAVVQAELPRHTALSYPVVTARCESRGIQTATKNIHGKS